MHQLTIPFNWPYMTGRELEYISSAHAEGKLSGDGPYTRKCHHWLEQTTGAHKALLTHSCTAALEMAAILLDIKPGDEIIMPSFTFVSTANPFAMRGGTHVFGDIRSDTLNIDEQLVEEAITPETRAIVVVHYAGIACNMDVILKIAAEYGLPVVEDAAQGVMASYNGRALGSIGTLGAYSFHETKNIISGEGGALLVNDQRLEHLAEVIREKGTDRNRFFRGEIEKYTWQSLGSSYLPSELVSAFLWAQFEEAADITRRRLRAWGWYHDRLESLEQLGFLRRPIIPTGCQHNGHIYYIILKTLQERQGVITVLKNNSISAVSHYVPLHSSPAGRKFGRVSGAMAVTDSLSERVLRLPMWIGLEEHQIQKVVDTIPTFFYSR